jgi:hypothetical protein
MNTTWQTNTICLSVGKYSGRIFRSNYPNINENNGIISRSRQQRGRPYLG